MARSPEYLIYAERLKSFSGLVLPPKKGRTKNTRFNWPHPNTFKATPERLAQAGYYFAPDKESNDRTECFFCGHQIAGWEEADDPFQEQATRASGCAWALARCSIIQDQFKKGKKIIWKFTDPSRLPTSREMEDARLQTFKGHWPHDKVKGHKCTSKAMAKAGFVFAPGVGEEVDNAQCPYCTRHLNEWSSNEDPLAEHKRREGDTCPFFTAQLEGDVESDAGKEALPSTNGKSKGRVTSGKSASSSQASKVASGSRASKVPSAGTSEPESSRRATRGRAASSRKKPGAVSEVETELETVEEDVTAVITKPTRGRKKTNVRPPSPSAESDSEVAIVAPKKGTKGKGKGKASKAAAAPTDTEEEVPEPAPVRKGRPKAKVAKPKAPTPPLDPDDVSDDDLLIGPPRKKAAAKTKGKSKAEPVPSPVETPASEPEPLPTRKRAPSRAAARQPSGVVSVTRSKKVAATAAESEDTENPQQASQSRASSRAAISRTVSKQSTAKTNGKRVPSRTEAPSESEATDEVDGAAPSVDEDMEEAEEVAEEEPPKPKPKPRAKAKPKAKGKTKALGKSTRGKGSAMTQSVSASSAAETDDADEAFESAAEVQSEAEPTTPNGDANDDVASDTGMGDATPQPSKPHRGLNAAEFIHRKGSSPPASPTRIPSPIRPTKAASQAPRDDGDAIMQSPPRPINRRQPSQPSGSGTSSRPIAPIPKVARNKASIQTPPVPAPVKAEAEDESIVEWFPDTAQKAPAKWKGKGKEIERLPAPALNGHAITDDDEEELHRPRSQPNGFPVPSTPRAAKHVQPIASPTPRSNINTKTALNPSPQTPPPPADDGLDILQPPDDSFTEEELSMTVEEWINFEIMRQHAVMEAEGKQLIKAFLDDAEKTRDHIRTL